MPTPAQLAMLSIVVAIVISFWRKSNAGLIALSLALPLGVGIGGLSGRTIINMWPVHLSVTLVGVTLLFAIIKVNGTLSLIARYTIRLARGNVFFIPWSIFLMSAVLAGIGPGNISICALLGPIAMAVAMETGISPLLMGAMLSAGSNAGGLSVVAPTGIIGVSLYQEIIGTDPGLSIWLMQVMSSLIWATLSFIILGGWKATSYSASSEQLLPKLERVNVLSLAAIALLVVAVVGFRQEVGLVSFSLAVVLLLLNAAGEKESIAAIPWSTIILVCGTAVLIGVASELGGITLLTSALQPLMNEATAPSIMAIVASVISCFASSSGVVMPTLFRVLPDLSTQLTSVSPLVLASAVVVGSHMVTIGPFSTLGALIAASLQDGQDKQLFFKQQMIAGLISIPFAGLVALLIAPLIG